MGWYGRHEAWCMVVQCGGARGHWQTWDKLFKRACSKSVLSKSLRGTMWREQCIIVSRS